MTFELVRYGWPNTAAILALALTPILAFTAATDRNFRGAAPPHIATAVCPTAAEYASLLVDAVERAIQ